MTPLNHVSVLTVVVAFPSGIATYWILSFDFQFYVKALCIALLLLTTLSLFINDLEKQVLRK